MNCSKLKAVITVEAAVVISLCLYAILFLIDTAIYFHDEACIKASLNLAGVKLQNYYECGTNLDTYTINYNTKEKKLDEEEYIKNSLNRRYLLSKIEDVNVKKKMINFEITARFKYIGITRFYRNKEIVKNLKLAKLIPSRDLRINKEIKSFVEKD